MGIVLLSGGALHALALASWHVSGGADWVGPIGAYVAESTIALLGTASVLLPWSCAVVSVRLFRRTVRPVRPFRSLGTAAIIATVSTGLHLWLNDWPALGGLPAGGLVGATLGELLRVTVGTAGAFTVVFTVLLVALVVRTRLSVVTVATNARDASMKGAVLAIDGGAMLARAWKEARSVDEREAKKRPATPRAPAPEELTAKALRPVLDAPPPPDEDDEDEVAAPEAVRSDPGPDALLGALTRSATDSEPKAPPAPVAARKSRRKVPIESPEPAATDFVIAVGPEPAPASAPAPRSPRQVAVVNAPVVEAPRPRESANVVAPEAPRPRESANAVAVERANPVTGASQVAVERANAVTGASQVAVESAKRNGGASQVAVESAKRNGGASQVAVEREKAVDAASEASDEPPWEPVRAKPASTRASQVANDELVIEEPTDGPLNIVSHDHEIERAKKVAHHVASDPSPPQVPAAVEMEFPSIDMLSKPPPAGVQFDEAHLRATAERLVKTLADYTIEGKVMEVHPGPVVTTFEVVPAAGTKLSKIARLSDDIAMSLEASKVRIVAPIPGKGRVGFEVPNAKRQMVYLRELIETEAFQNLGGALPVALGKDVVGAPYFADLATMPHLIVAGATGQGKSVGLNVMLASLLYKRGPEDVRMLMVDPKMVELAVYDNIPHMLLPVVTDMKKAALALRWVVDEMERRYSLFAQTGSRNIVTYNERVAKAVAEGKSLRGADGPVRTKETGTTVEIKATDGESHDVTLAKAGAAQPRKLPYIVVVVDEFADLIMVAGKDIEAAVARLAQKARAAGIHVILATQRPSVDVITGMIKANFPARIAFKVSQKLDSRVILDQQGAEHLLGKGDMLILPPGASDLRRVHCAFVNEDEVQRITDHWREQGRPTFDEDILKPREDEEAAADDGPAEIKVPQEKYEKAVALVLSQRKCSVSFVQRYLGIGYNVAARIVDKMEREGIVGAPKGPGKDREVLG